ncbi:endonuclease VII domain-containing protein [Streptomyces sp. 3N207]|uniref:endonuclease VII domain-containing protein n=1 Tax=Streptomyces sp. 3N207 TaxID=3457417 RepID=UPI003FCFDDCC
MARYSATHYRRRRAALGKKVREKIVVPAGHKFCRICEKAKHHAEWHKNATASDDLSTRCKECKAAQGRAGHLKRQYGMTVGQRKALLDEQFGICPICLKPGPEHVDHDHETGRVRGVLCFSCNAALGQFRDRPDVMRRAAAYVEGNVWKPKLVAPGVYRLPS